MKTIDRFQYLRAGLKGLVAPVSLGVCVIATAPDGRVPLIRHTYRAGWYLPGGGVDRGETAERAAIRELTEETGMVQSGPPALFGFYLRRNGRHSDYIAVYTVPDVMVKFRATAEIAELCMAAPDTPPQGTSDGTRRRLEEFVGKTPPSPQW